MQISILSIFLFSLFCRCLTQYDALAKNNKATSYLSKYPGGLKFDEACVMCRFIVQKIDKSVDSTRECPEIAKTLRLRDQQREWQPDPSFLAKWKALYDLRNKQQDERTKPFKHQDDEYYYIIHPDHIKKYLKLQCPDCGPSNSGNNNNGGGKGGGGDKGDKGGGGKSTDDGRDKKRKKADDSYGNINERKLIIYHDVDKSEPFPHELKVVHEFANVTSSKISEKKSTNDDTQKATSFANSNNLLAVNSQGGNVNGISSLEALEQRNGNALANFFHSKEKGRFIRKPHEEMRFAENEQNINNLNYLSNSNIANYIGKSSPPAIERPAESNSNQDSNNAEELMMRRPMVMKVDQKKIDKIFKDQGNTLRYNAYPYPDNYLPHSEHTGMPGNFILDKNINRDKDTPEYILMPDEKAYQPEMRRGTGQDNQVFPSRFREIQGEGNEERFAEKKSTISDSILNSFSPDFKGSQDYRTPTVSPASNIYDIMNNGLQYKAEGKAMLPPHPEDMRPGFDCCMQPPCVMKPPCAGDNEAKTKEAFRFLQTNADSNEPTIEVSNENANVFRDQFNNSPKEIQNEYTNYLNNVAMSVRDEQKPNELYSFFYSQSPQPSSQGQQQSQIEIGANPSHQSYEGGNTETLSMLGLNQQAAVAEPIPQQEAPREEPKPQQLLPDSYLTQMKNIQFDSGNNVMFIPPPLIYQPQQPIPTSFLQTSEKAELSSTKTFPLNRNSSALESFAFRQLNPDGVFEYDPHTGRRGRRKADLPDPEWDCLDKNISDLLHFICEQEVALTFTKYCQPLIEQREVLIESFLYHDSTMQACQNMNMCPWE